MTRLIAILTLIFGIFFGIGCDIPGEAVGSYRKIPVLIDSGEMDEIAPLLSEAVERKLFTPRDEKVFQLEFVDTIGHSWLKNARTAIIVASLESPGPAGQYIRSVLSPDVIKAVKASGYWIAVKKDFWTEGQLVVFVTAPTKNALAVRIHLGGDELFRIINNSVNERVSKWLFGSAFGGSEQIDLEDSIAADYGFGIRVPRFWTWEKGIGDERFLWLRVLEPERWVFVWFSDLETEQDFTLERWRHIRDSLCAIYYEGDSVSPHTAPETTGVFIGGRPAVQIRALWENSNTNLGGPIVSYVLSDPVTRRLFIVDGAVFAPAIKKEPYLRHVEIVCKSFRADLPEFYRERESRE